MRILYVANHDQVVSNDEEGAIAHALRALGHTVILIQQRSTMSASDIAPADLCLFHKLADWSFLRSIKYPKVFWYFDQVYNADVELAARSSTRVSWANQAVDVADMGFFTDGDWVAKDLTGKLRWLPQGADERIVGYDHPLLKREEYLVHLRGPEILFTGSAMNCGQKRTTFVRDMQQRWGERFVHVGRGLHGILLRKIIGTSLVVVAPDFPITDLYWSNRIYLTLGFGGLLLHPWSRGVVRQFPGGGLFYQDRDHLNELIQHALAASPELLESIRQNGLENIKAAHLYRHRCKRLIEEVKEKLGI